MADTTVRLPLNECIGPYGLGAGDCRREEQWLVAGLRQGHEGAYETLVLRYQQPVYNLVYRLMEDPSDTSDIVQEVFLKVFRNIGSFRGQSSLKTWLYRIAVNEAHNHRRWFNRHRRQETAIDDDERDTRSYQETLHDPGRSPFDLALNRETQVLIEDALAQLNPNFRAAVVLRDIEDLSYEEIAEVLQLSIGTVKSRILRGREALRKQLLGRLESSQARQWTPQPAE
ncbi:MAG: sigma-70 family RNA polymerase sigma factor [Bryobacteraceae bacterium]